MLPEQVHPWIAIAATIFVFVGLQVRRGAPTDLLFLIALVVVLIAGVIEPDQAFRGFANPAVLTIAALLVVAAGLRSAGVLDWLGRKLLGNVSSERGALVRLIPTLIAASAFMLNTALVASQRIGLAGGAQVRLGAVDIEAAYMHVFFDEVDNEMIGAAEC